MTEESKRSRKVSPARARARPPDKRDGSSSSRRSMSGHDQCMCICVYVYIYIAIAVSFRHCKKGINNATIALSCQRKDRSFDRSRPLDHASESTATSTFLKSLILFYFALKEILVFVWFDTTNRIFFDGFSFVINSIEAKYF